jgi:hypothetical protein
VRIIAVPAGEVLAVEEGAKALRRLFSKERECDQAE